MRLAYQSCRGCPRLSLKCGRTRPFSSPGGLAERFNAADLKSVSPQGLGGSNPSPSAKHDPRKAKPLQQYSIPPYDEAHSVLTCATSSSRVQMRYVGWKGGRRWRARYI